MTWVIGNWVSECLVYIHNIGRYYCAAMVWLLDLLVSLAGRHRGSYHSLGVPSLQIFVFVDGLAWSDGLTSHIKRQVLRLGVVWSISGAWVLAWRLPVVSPGKLRLAWRRSHLLANVPAISLLALLADTVTAKLRLYVDDYLSRCVLGQFLVVLARLSFSSRCLVTRIHELILWQFGSLEPCCSGFKPGWAAACSFPFFERISLQCFVVGVNSRGVIVFVGRHHDLIYRVHILEICLLWNVLRLAELACQTKCTIEFGKLHADATNVVQVALQSAAPLFIVSDRGAFHQVLLLCSLHVYIDELLMFFVADFPTLGYLLDHEW